MEIKLKRQVFVPKLMVDKVRKKLTIRFDPSRPGYVSGIDVEKNCVGSDEFMILFTYLHSMNALYAKDIKKIVDMSSFGTIDELVKCWRDKVQQIVAHNLE